jgi:hypothetical protein
MRLASAVAGGRMGDGVIRLLSMGHDDKQSDASSAAPARQRRVHSVTRIRHNVPLGACSSAG